MRKKLELIDYIPNPVPDFPFDYTGRLKEGYNIVYALFRADMPQWRYGYALAQFGYATDEVSSIMNEFYQRTEKNYDESTKH